jgi:hypothetical protein
VAGRRDGNPRRRHAREKELPQAYNSICPACDTSCCSLASGLAASTASRTCRGLMVEACEDQAAGIASFIR